MKIAVTMAFTACLVLSACKKDTHLSVLTTLTGESGITYDESLEKWNALKALNGDSYIYQSTFVSWTGSGTITEIRVENGVATRRKYQAFETSGVKGERTVISSYVEEERELGRDERGARPLTIDELYATCAKEYLIADTELNTLLFNTDSRGLMSLCGYVPDNCLDDCFQGVNIYGFDWLN